MNLIDLFYIFLFLGMLALGFFHGMIRLTILLMAFYLSLVLASLYIEPVGGFLKTHFGGSRDATLFGGFGLTLMLSFLRYPPLVCIPFVMPKCPASSFILIK